MFITATKRRSYVRYGVEATSNFSQRRMCASGTVTELFGAFSQRLMLSRPLIQDCMNILTWSA